MTDFSDPLVQDRSQAEDNETITRYGGTFRHEH